MTGRPRPAWQQLVSAAPVGIAVVLFVSIRWPWDLLAVGALLAYAGLLAALLGRKRHPGLLREILLLFGFLFLALFTALAGYTAASLPQPWLPVAAVGALAATTMVVGAIVVWAPHRRRSR